MSVYKATLIIFAAWGIGNASPARAAERDFGARPECNRHRVEAGERTGTTELCRFAAVTFQQPAELLLTTNLGERNSFGFGGRQFLFSLRLWLYKQIVVEPLMGALTVIVFQPDFGNAFEMCLPKENEVIQALTANRPDEAFHECPAVGIADRALDCFRMMGSQRVVESRVFTIAITLHARNTQAIRASLLDDIRSFLDNPHFRRMLGGGRQNNPPRLDVQKREQINRAKAFVIENSSAKYRRAFFIPPTNHPTIRFFFASKASRLPRNCI